MTTNLLLGFLLTTTLTANAAPAARPAEDPCALARRISESPPCLAGSACEAFDLWREYFGPPDFFPAGAEKKLPPKLVARLPKSDVSLGKVGSFESAFKRLGEASGIDVLVHPDLAKEEIAGELRPMPLEKAWRVLLGAPGLVARFDGERVLIASTRALSDRPGTGPLGRPRVSTFKCPVR
ncbi:MAG TPA: hypothetical protein VF756_15860 [Thermoanaerobaculia bacterium]